MFYEDIPKTFNSQYQKVLKETLTCQNDADDLTLMDNIFSVQLTKVIECH